MLARAAGMAEEILEKVRSLSLNLGPGVLGELGLLPALLQLVGRVREVTGIRVDFCHRDLDRRFGPSLETGLYRIVQEALTNVARHAGVGHAIVDVEVSEDAVVAAVQDEGRGFDPASLPAGTSGIAGMRERAELLGGRLRIVSAPGHGTLIVARLPRVGSEDDADQGPGVDTEPA